MGIEATGEAVRETDFKGLGKMRRGKVRDLYDLGETLLLVATDRVSAFDWVLPTPIPGKGKLLTGLSTWWFGVLKDVPNHLVTDDVARMPKKIQPFAQILAGRTMLVKKVSILPVECVVRGYLAGSGWDSYQKTREVCGVALPAGLEKGSRLPEPIFTPTTKAEKGHDEPMSLGEVERVVGKELAGRLQVASLSLYTRAHDIAAARGVLLADTKFEWGLAGSAKDLTLADEVLTPDSSRFWPAEDYRPGEEQPSFDKQFIRDFLLGTAWDRKSPPPPLPADIVDKTRQRYVEAYRRLVGKEPG